MISSIGLLVQQTISAIDLGRAEIKGRTVFHILIALSQVRS